MFLSLNYSWVSFFVLELWKVRFSSLNFEKIHFYTWISSLDFFIKGQNSWWKMNFSKFRDKKQKPNLLKKCFFFLPNMTLMMFIWKIDWFKIVFFKDDFSCENRFWERWLLIVTKNDFHLFFKFKKNLVKNQTTFTSNFKKIYLKIIFYKDDFYGFF